MADITKCKGTTREAFPLSVEIEVTEDFECPMKETCYRYKAVASEHWQSYFIGVPYDKEKEDCEHYWKM